jgi:arsenate reductase
MKDRILFVCIHNSARSQMAEAWLNEICGEKFEAESAGLEPGALNPLVVAAMKEIGIDISQKKTRSVSEVLRSGVVFAYVVTVCDESSSEKCPVFPGPARRLHWSFPDPSTIAGTTEEKMAKVREIRDQIRARIERWCDEVDEPTRTRG